MTDTVASALTYKAIEEIWRDGGSQAWKGDRKRLSKMKYVVCVRNRHGPQKPEGPEPHRQAFLVGKITAIVDADMDGQAVKPNGDPRAKIAFAEYALVEVPNVPLAGRFPVQYWPNLASLGIDEDALVWEQMPEQVVRSPMDRAKAIVADAHGVTPDRVDITIRF